MTIFFTIEKWEKLQSTVINIFFSNYFQINSSHAWPLKCKRHFSSHFISKLSKQKLYFTDTLFFFFFFYFSFLIWNHCSKLWIDCLMCYVIRYFSSISSCKTCNFQLGQSCLHTVNTAFSRLSLDAFQNHFHILLERRLREI